MMQIFVAGMLVLILLTGIFTGILLWAVRKQNCVTQDMLVKRSLRREAERNEAMEALNRTLKLCQSADHTLPRIMIGLEKLNRFSMVWTEENTAAAGKTAEILSAIDGLGTAIRALKPAMEQGEEELEALRSWIEDLHKETVRSVNGLDDVYQAVSELEKAAKGDPEAGGEADQAQRAMLEGFDQLMSYSVNTARGRTE